jgi:tripartite-type tricarboxylate transporter receptor subunit TctC
MNAVMRTTARGAIWATALLVASSCLAQTSGYPNRPVKVIVPFPPGGATDVIVRLITQKLSVSLGQQFYAENHAGAGGNIGMGMAASAPADGYTMLAVTNSFILNPSLYARIPYDPIRDFSPLTLTATSPYVVAVHPSLPARSVGELIALVRANPGKYSYASAGLGTPGHLAGELFRSPLGLDLVHVPFSGGPPAINATIAGHTPVSFTALPTAAPQVKDGKLRALAVMSSKRAAALPDVPTMAEAGIPDCEVDIVAGMVVRSETPDDIAQRLHGEIVKALAQPEIRERLSTLGFEPVASTRDEFAAWIKAEIPRWRRVIHGVNIPKVE